MKHQYKAVFLDRDGVINHNVFYSDSQEWESPRKPEELKLISGVFLAIKKIQQANYKIFIVSNQPSAAKGKTSIDNLKAISSLLLAQFKKNNIYLTEAYYCYHHPAGIIPSYTKQCLCRKPSPYFLLQAQKKYQLDLKKSWMIGDRVTDIECGQKAGVKVLGITPDHPCIKPQQNKVVWHKNLTEATSSLLKENY